MKLASKSMKLTTFIEIIIECTFLKFLLRLQTEIHTSPSSPSLTYFQNSSATFSSALLQYELIYQRFVILKCYFNLKFSFSWVFVPSKPPLQMKVDWGKRCAWFFSRVGCELNGFYNPHINLMSYTLNNEISRLHCVNDFIWRCNLNFPRRKEKRGKFEWLQ